MKKFLVFFTLFVATIAVNAENLRFVQVSDTLFSLSDEKSIENLQNVIQDINKQRNVSFVIFTGNNIAKPNKTDLEGFIEMAKELNVPYYVALGNKDVNKQKDFGKKEYIKVLSKNLRRYKKIESPNYVFEKAGVIFIVADGSKEVIPSPIGYYKADVLSWLEEQLNLYSDKNVVILQHFPIVPPAKKESHYTYKAEEYLAILAKHKNVKAVIAGHFNVNNEQKVNGILHISTEKAPSYRIIDLLDCDTDSPSFWSICR